jgi:hypothetical protein
MLAYLALYSLTQFSLGIMLDIAGQEARIQYQGCSYGLDVKRTCHVPVQKSFIFCLFFAIVVLNLRTQHSLPSFCFLIGVYAKNTYFK